MNIFLSLRCIPFIIPFYISVNLLPVLNILKRNLGLCSILWLIHFGYIDRYLQRSDTCTLVRLRNPFNWRDMGSLYNFLAYKDIMLSIQCISASVKTSIFTFNWVFVYLNQIQALKLVQPLPYLFFFLYSIDSVNASCLTFETIVQQSEHRANNRIGMLPASLIYLQQFQLFFCMIILFLSLATGLLQSVK